MAFYKGTIQELALGLLSTWDDFSVQINGQTKILLFVSLVLVPSRHKELQLAFKMREHETYPKVVFRGYHVAL